MTDINTKEKIIQSASELFGIYGLRGASIREIADHADVNPALINYHFESKEGLYRFILDEYAQAARANVDGILATADSEAEFKIMLKIYLQKSVESMVNHKNSFLVVMRESDFMQPEYKYIFDEVLGEFSKEFIGFLETAKKKKIIPKKVDSVFCMHLFWSVLVYYMRLDSRFNKTKQKSLSNKKTRNDILNEILSLYYAKFGFSD
jgi:AcrR family transcriptional regulator